MLAQRERIQGVSVFRRFVPAIGVASVVAIVVSSGGPTRGQTNIDQGKPASELFANYCAVCHKSTRGLANGRNGLTLSLFLREHYAASRDQAAALAAYVISAGGNAPAAKPERARSEEPKGQETRGQDSKGHEAKPRAASASPKSEPEKPLREGQPGREEATPGQEEPAPVIAAPAASPSPSSAEAPEMRSTTSAGVSESQSNDSAPVPRDNIPD
jgi:hypothetical protein